MTTALDLCSLAWSDQQGYVALALRDPTVDRHSEGYWKDLIFKWPDDKARVGDVLQRAKQSKRDVYWAPAVFRTATRAADEVGDVRTLWADLDTADPTKLPKNLKPAAAWETSPGRWQALWLLDKPITADFQSNLNQRLTYTIGADKGGWDLTQVLRTPNTPNYKYPDAPKVKMLWMNGHKLNAVELNQDLPDVSTPKNVELPDVRRVIKKVKLNARTKQLLNARHATVGTRSDRLWELECLLAEQGLQADEIASIARQSVWNKFEGRHDEVKRLLTEAEKAISHAGPTITETDDEFEEVEDVSPLTWSEFDRDHKPIRWLVADIWGESEVGFISGLPKSYKSWMSLDLAVSVATGTRFVGVFQTRKQNVLLIQEEDPRPILQDRLVKVAGAKNLVWANVVGDVVEMQYALPDNLFIISNQGFTLTEEWLATLEMWIIEHNIGLVILDPLMMVAAGGFDEFKAFEFMDKVLKPLKRLRARTQSAIVLVHHHIKGSNEAGARAMYGSVALWAWEEAALHLQISGVGKIVAERFSKHSLLPPITVEIGDVSQEWAPTLAIGADSTGSLLDVLTTMESGATVDELTTFTGLGRDAINRQLRKLEEEEKVEKIDSVRGRSGGRRAIVWGATTP